jgi:hypothetical protein
MDSETNTVEELYCKRIEGTKTKERVIDAEVLVGKINARAYGGAKLRSRRVYITARVIKKLYDTRSKESEEHFLFIIRNIKSLIVYPDAIYKNKEFPSKKRHASHILIKKVNQYKYLCFVQQKTDSSNQLQILTIFPIGLDDPYLEGFSLLWG